MWWHSPGLGSNLWAWYTIVCFCWWCASIHKFWNPLFGCSTLRYCSVFFRRPNKSGDKGFLCPDLFFKLWPDSCFEFSFFIFQFDLIDEDALRSRACMYVCFLVAGPFNSAHLHGMYSPTHFHSTPPLVNKIRFFLISQFVSCFLLFAFVLFVRAMCCLLMLLGFSRTAARFVCCNSVLPFTIF